TFQQRRLLGLRRDVEERGHARDWRYALRGGTNVVKSHKVAHCGKTAIVHLCGMHWRERCTGMKAHWRNTMALLSRGWKPKRLRDQVIVITGASSGIGLATARLGAGRCGTGVATSRNN